MKPAEETKTKVELSEEEIERVTGGVDTGYNYDTSEDLVDTPNEKSTYTRKPRVTPSKSRFKR